MTFTIVYVFNWVHLISVSSAKCNFDIQYDSMRQPTLSTCDVSWDCIVSRRRKKRIIKNVTRNGYVRRRANYNICISELFLYNLPETIVCFQSILEQLGGNDFCLSRFFFKLSPFDFHAGGTEVFQPSHCTKLRIPNFRYLRKTIVQSVSTICYIVFHWMAVYQDEHTIVAQGNGQCM